MRTRLAFTLVELLVVVTIIVVLLALLLPAMGKAIYQANLAVCAATQRGVVTSIQHYAFDSKQFYPNRGLAKKDRESHTSELGPMQIYNGDQYDLRPPLKGYVGSVNKQMQCPLIEPVEMEKVLSGVHVESSYMFYWGWVYKAPNGRGEAGMFKIGDRFESPPETGRPNRSYNVLMSDMDLRYANVFAQAAHPDREPQRMSPTVWESVAAYAKVFTLSRWSTPQGTVTRGSLDLNFSYDDGSTRRFVGVIGWDREDPHMDNLPLQFDLITPEDRLHLPTP